VIIFLDTNILLDVMLDREPFSIPAARILSAIDSGRHRGAMCANSLTTVHYVARRSVPAKEALRCVEHLLAILEVAPVGREVLEAALRSAGRDFEDNVAAEAARAVGADMIVTRDPKGFADCGIEALDAASALARIEGDSHEGQGEGA